MPSSVGMWPYGISPWTMRWPPSIPASPTSITFESTTFSVVRKPIRKTVAASRAHTGQTGRDDPPRPRTPTQIIRPRRYASGG